MNVNQTTTANLAAQLANGKLARHHGIAESKLKDKLDAAADQAGIDRWAIRDRQADQLVEVVASDVARTFGGLPADA